MAKLTFIVEIHEEDDGSFWAEVKELPGCFASGFSMKELKEGVEEAMRLWLPDGIEFEHLQWGEPKPDRTPGGKPKSRGKKPQRLLVCA